MFDKQNILQYNMWRSNTNVMSFLLADFKVLPFSLFAIKKHCHSSINIFTHNFYYASSI
jgi:hypothetical protein